MRPEVVELTVPYAVPDIVNYVQSVDVMIGGTILRNIY
jgi:hypothetical protein